MDKYSDFFNHLKKLKETNVNSNTYFPFILRILNTDTNGQVKPKDYENLENFQQAHPNLVIQDVLKESFEAFLQNNSFWAARKNCFDLSKNIKILPEKIQNINAFSLGIPLKESFVNFLKNKKVINAKTDLSKLWVRFIPMNNNGKPFDPVTFKNTLMPESNTENNGENTNEAK